MQGLSGIQTQANSKVCFGMNPPVQRNSTDFLFLELNLADSGSGYLRTVLSVQKIVSPVPDE